jgi:outer membrane protein assembly factor BamD
MFTLLVSLAFLNSIPGGVNSTNERILHLANEANCSADHDMEIGRYYISKHDQTAAVFRFKLVITRCPKSAQAEEALAHLADIGLELRLPTISQNAVAVLERKFPNGQWTIEARGKLRSAGLEPAEDEKSWVAGPFQ